MLISTPKKSQRTAFVLHTGRKLRVCVCPGTCQMIPTCPTWALEIDDNDYVQSFGIVFHIYIYISLLFFFLFATKLKINLQKKCGKSLAAAAVIAMWHHRTTKRKNLFVSISKRRQWRRLWGGTATPFLGRPRPAFGSIMSLQNEIAGIKFFLFPLLLWSFI